MNSIGRYISDFASLVFPKICHACGTSLAQSETHFCTTCIHQLPYTNFHLQPDNKLAKQFWGRVKVASAIAYLYFTKGGKVQNIMHQLKYNKQPQLGVALGKMYGEELKKNQLYQQAEAIIPVPLHPSKLKKRGYNQSETFANGLSEVLGIPVLSGILYRESQKDSQTMQSRSHRFDNMEKVFKANTQTIELNNVLLVDDTITTGATLEACIIALQDVGITQINIIGIAYTE
ncbi:ComF family protein [Pedobacter alpinus]|uniref:ComF family protein n=1 Tax=Pedobacter alpinus TaxID=1590643 RepID=A0ABW5TQG0_9SPHI